MKPFISFLLIAFLAGSRCMAQSSYDDLNAVSIPSPNNDFLKSQQDFGVTLYAGTPQINVPLYKLPSKELSIPISLVYSSASGIKVQDIAGFVGLGWQLNAGGYISRVVRGRPDEQDSGYIGIHLFGQTIASSGLTSTVINEIGKGDFDGEPDIFTINTPTFAFEFVLDQNGNPVFPNNTGLKISHTLYNNPSYKSGTSWVVTDADGTQYFFGTTSNSREDMTVKLSGKSQSFTSTWYLDKIVSFNAGDAITFTYIAGADYSVNHYMSSQTSWDASPTCTAPSPLTNSYSDVYTYNAPKYISFVSSSQGFVQFNYSFDRQDISTAARLASLNVYSTAGQIGFPASVLLETLQFNYSYFGTPPGADVSRLRLDNIDLLAIGTEPTLRYKSFDYNLTANLPARNSVEFDYWGYYNTNTTGTAIVPTANKNPDPNRTSANMLTGIHDLSGQVQQFQYEPNTYYNSTLVTNVPVAGVRVNKISKVLPTGESLYTQYLYNDANNRSTGQLYNQNYSNFTKAVNFLFVNGSNSCGVSGTNTMSETIYNSYDLNGNFVGYSSVKILSQNGGYEVDQFTNFSDFLDLYSAFMSDGTVYAFQSARQLSCGTSLAYKRGLLKYKTTYTAANIPVTQVQNIYGPLDGVTVHAQGARVLPFTLLLGSSVTVWIYGTYVSNVENYRLVQSIQTNYDQNDPTLVQQTTTNFTYAANHRLVSRADYSDSKGLPESKVSYYAEDGNIPLLDGDQQYAINQLVSGNKTNAVIHSVETHNNSSRSTHFSYLNFTDPSGTSKVFLANKETFTNNNTAQIEKRQYQYDPTTCNLIASNMSGGPFLSTQYGYNNTLPVAKVKNAVNTNSTTQSNGTAVQDFTLAIAISISQSATIVVDYTGTVSFQVWPDVGNLEATIQCSLFGPSTYGGFVCTSVSNSCGANGSTLSIPNVVPGTYTVTVQYYLTNNNTSATVDIECDYPKKTAAPLFVNEFFYEGFEFVSGAATNTPFAGKAYNAGPYTVPFTTPNARSYQIDYHYLSGGIWHAVTKPFVNGMVLSDGVGIDEVRVYPTDAQMTTYTYSPMIGITSQCDPRNRATFYIYDSFGRLTLTRDNDGNIINNYDYQYQLPLQ